MMVMGGALLAVERAQVEMAHPLRIAEDIDLDDLPAPDREGHDREELSFEHADHTGCAVDERRSPLKVEAREALRSTSPLFRTPAAVGGTTPAGRQARGEPLEVTVRRSRAKGVDDASLNLHVGIGGG